MDTGKAQTEKAAEVAETKNKKFPCIMLAVAFLLLLMLTFYSFLIHQPPVLPNIEYASNPQEFSAAIDSSRFGKPTAVAMLEGRPEPPDSVGLPYRELLVGVMWQENGAILRANDEPFRVLWSAVDADAWPDLDATTELIVSGGAEEGRYTLSAPGTDIAESTAEGLERTLVLMLDKDKLLILTHAE